MDETTAKAIEIDEAQTEAREMEIDKEKPKILALFLLLFFRFRLRFRSDSDSDSDGEAADETQIQTLESRLKVHGITMLTFRKLGHIKKLLQARESMKDHFPLTPKMWQEWTKDEVSLNASSEAFTDIEKLYEYGAHEYLSVPLWCDYLNFVQERNQLVSQCAPAGVLKMRNLFECALTAVGLHIAEGSKIWEAYREYEQAIFVTIGDDNNEGKSKQVHRIHALFHRQLSVPLVDLKSTLENYKLWEVEKGDTSDTNLEVDGR